MIEALAERVSELNTQATSLRHEVERRVNRQTWTLVTVSLLAVALFVVNLIVMASVLRGVHDSRASRKAAEQNTAQIKDCIDPQGTCFKQQSKRTNAIIGKLITDDQKNAKETQDLIEQIAAHFHLKVVPAK